MDVIGVVGVLALPLFHMESVCGKILEGGGTWFFLFEIGDGSKVQFWLDSWCGSSSLTDCYAELFRIFRSKKASVADIMRFTNGVLHWEIHFCREVHNWELEAFRSFINTIYCTPVKGF